MSLRYLIRHFEDRAALCVSVEELYNLLDDASRELGFHHFAIVHHVSFRRDSPSFVSIDNYPEAWAEEFVGKQLFLDDPVLQASQRTAKGFAWTDVAGLLTLRPHHRDVLDRSVRYGMGSGFTVPANVPGEPCGSCSFAVKRGRSLPERRLRCAELIGIDAFETARRLYGYPRPDHPRHLSRRERQCVRLLAAGKTDWEAAKILGLSPETTRRYVKTARAAYDVVSRTQLVVHALRDGQISFDDAIAPSG